MEKIIVKLNVPKGMSKIDFEFHTLDILNRYNNIEYWDNKLLEQTLAPEERL